MKTSKIFKDNLKNKIITLEMLEQVLYSINKRAKNCRDKKFQYRREEYREQYESRKNEYYEQKEYLLKTLLKPNCIHLEQGTKEYTKVYAENDNEFYSIPNEMLIDEWTNREGINLRKYRVVEKYKSYYLYFTLPNTSFHIPIYEDEMKEYDLDIVELTELKTFGKDIKELTSVQFCRQFIEVISGGDFTFLKTENNK